MNSLKPEQKQKLTIILLLAAALLLLILIALVLHGKRAAAPPAPTEISDSLPEKNPYRPQDFTWENGFLTAPGAVLGVDVSEHQTTVDWHQAAEAGVEFAFVRAGWRGYTEGKLFTDTRFEAHLAGAREAGLDTGVYFFSQAVSPEEARQEAEYVLRLLDGRELELPVVYDWEFISQEARTAQVSGRTVTENVLAFCQVIEEAGYEAMVYFNPDMGRNLLDLKALGEIPFWLAMYSDVMDYPYRVSYWQYTGEGRVPGFDTPVDLNLYLPPRP